MREDHRNIMPVRAMFRHNYLVERPFFYFSVYL